MSHHENTYSLFLRQKQACYCPTSAVHQIHLLLRHGYLLKNIPQHIKFFRSLLWLLSLSPRQVGTEQCHKAFRHHSSHSPTRYKMVLPLLPVLPEPNDHAIFLYLYDKPHVLPKEQHKSLYYRERRSLAKDWQLLFEAYLKVQLLPPSHFSNPQ